MTPAKMVAAALMLPALTLTGATGLVVWIVHRRR